MEVILIKPVRKLGKIGEIHKVAAGVRSQLSLTAKLAVRATELNKEFIAQQKHELEEKDQKIKAEVVKINELIKNQKLTFIRQTSEDGKLFGSVSSKEIADQLSEKVSYSISHLNIVLDKQIKSTGLYVVEVRLHPELSTNVTVIVARSESEIQDYLREQKTESLAEPLAESA